jgi:hypothetical protein
MTSILNKCNNLDELTNFNNNISPALSQGEKFKHLQNKFINKTNKNVDLVEGFENTLTTTSTTGTSSTTKEVISSDDPAYKGDPVSENPLTTKSNEIIQVNTENRELNITLEELRKKYDTSLKQYQDLMDRIEKKSQEYLKRTTNNPYLGKTIRFTTGHICYVTEQGIVKYIPNPEIWDSVAGKNGCGVTKTYTEVNVKYPSSGTQGTYIKELNLVLGPHMQLGETCGNAGKNVYVSKLLDNPKEKYIGCYNDKKPVEYFYGVPIMSATNYNTYGLGASSIYQNDNNSCGPWAAFDRNPNTFWHSEVGANYNYNGTTGEYIGKSSLNYKDANGNIVTARGEYLAIVMGYANIYSKYDVLGRQNCCGNPNGRSPNSWIILGGVYGQPFELIDKRDNEGLSYEKRSYYISNPKKYNYYIFLTTNCGNPGDRTGNRYCVQIAEWNLYTSSGNGFNDSQRAMIYQPNIVGYTKFDTCKKYAAENGYKYFGMQDVKSDGNAACLVSNDLASTQKYGKAYKYKAEPIWSTNTTGTGAVALLNNQGSLVVNNSSNAAVWASPNSSGLVGNYLGCYADCSLGRGLPTHTGWANINTCRDAAVKNNAKYYGLQWTQSNGYSECWIGSDLNKARSMGKASNCTKLNGNMVGGGCSNAVYNTYEASISSFLILQDDGNMVVYRGTSPSDNQGVIWATGTNRKQKEKNSLFSADKSKLGKNWIPNGTTLAVGEFVGSNDGSIYLLMQTDGNLVLYTNGEKVDGCSTNSSGKQMGGQWINAIYEFANSGFKQNIGKLGFVDENDTLYEYPSNNVQFNNNYTKVDKYDAYGADLPNAAYGNTSVDSCKETCNKRNDCYGFAYDNQNNVCYPKSSAMWPYGGPSRPLDRVDTYIKNKLPKSVPLGATNDTMNIDSAQYQFYNKGSQLPKQYGLMIATEADKTELARLEATMKQQSSDISNYINKFNKGTIKSETQADKNLKGLNTYETELDKTNSQINKLNSKSDNEIQKESFKNYGYTTNNNINKILLDSDIAVLQKNYEYLLWSILAAGSVIITMNISKN